MKTFNCFAITLLVLFCLGCSPKGQKSSGSPTISETAKGDFESVAGVKDVLSCFCSNGGYITTVKGKRVGVCLEEGINTDCKQMSVKGTYVEKTIPADPADPCSGQSAVYIKATEVKCLD